MSEEFFKEKIAALLHDPPTKAWFVAGVKTGKSHRDEARDMVKKIFKGTNLLDIEGYLNKDKIIGADKLSASVDRYLLGILIGDKHGALHVPYIKVKNPFNPEITKEISLDLEEKKIEELYTELNDILKLANKANRTSIKLAYFLLYSFYELIWINKGLPISPSDTRVPLSSVFDHNYATASLLNFIDEQGNLSEGLIVVIDIPSVQGYISASRKLRDLWASSYLVSALIWSVVMEFIKIFGPDILVIPTARFNAFFYHSMFSLISHELNLNEDELDKLASYLRIKDVEGREILIYDPRSGFPRFAVIPATVTLFLPSLNRIKQNEEFKQLAKNSINSEIKDAEDIKMLINKIFREKWREIYKSLKNISGNRNIDKFVKSIIENILEKIKGDYNFDTVPPFNPRIIILKLEDIINEIRENEKYKNIEYKDINYIIYHRIFEKINEELSELKSLKIESFVELNITKFTEDIYNDNVPKEFESLGIITKGKGFYYCTVCGHLPSVLNLPRNDEEFEKFIKNKLKVEMDDKNIESFAPYFSQGEKLCPYCLLKRIFSINPKIVLKGLLGSIEIQRKDREKKEDLSNMFELEVPSLADISTYAFKESLILKLKEKPNELSAKLSGLISKIKISEPYITKSLWVAQQKLEQKLNQINLDEQIRKYLTKFFILKESEELFFTKRDEIDRRREWSELKRDMNIEEPISIYYALIRCDGDNIGKLISGSIKDILYDFRKYLENSYEGASKNIIENIHNEIKVREILKENNIEEENFNRFKKLLEFINQELKGNILVTMAYHTSLSRALMANALYDVNIVENDYNGFVVYAGGDDLLALCPVYDSLQITSKTRKIYKDGTSLGFNCLGNNYYVPTVAITGRSYSIYYAHYKYPMYFIIYNSYKKLEESAKKSEWYLGNDMVSKKDTSCLVYSPRGGEILSIIPLEIKCSNGYIDTVIKLVELSENGVISTSLIYKLVNKDNLMRWEKLIEANPELFIKDLIHTLTKEVRDIDKPKLEFLNKWIERNYNLKLNKDKYLFEYMFKALRIIISSYRGVA